MSMQDAISAMHRRGLEPSQMQFSSNHNAFDLPDGRTVVLFGDKSVDEISIIVNPDGPKSVRQTMSVQSIAL
jgi:hypothetical protein